MCVWKWNDREELWGTSCGSFINDDEKEELTGAYEAKHCLWCGEEIEVDESDAGSARREEEAGLRRDYYEAVRPRW